MTDKFADLYSKGLNLYKKEEFKKAINLFSKAKSLKSDHCDLYFYIGESYIRIGDVDKAISEYQEGLKLCPGDLDIKTALNRATQQSSRDDIDENELELRESIKNNPDVLNNYLVLADCLGFKGEKSATNEEIDILKTAINKFPAIGDSYMLLAGAYKRKGLDDDAISISEKGVRIDPYCVEIDNIFYSLEGLYRKKGSYVKAIKKYLSLILKRKNQDDISYHFALAHAYFNKGDLFSAKEEFRFVQKNSRDDNYLKQKIEEIDDKIKKIKELDELVNKFERELRKFIERKCIIKKLDIWDAIANSELYNRIKERTQSDLTKRPNLSEDDLDPLDYFQLFDYNKLIAMNWETFKNDFKSQKRLEQNIEYITEFRNQVRHNRNTDEITMQFCKGALSWFEKIISKTPN
jgi:tetratricopeptide (TPR) repeat protein